MKAQLWHPVLFTVSLVMSSQVPAQTGPDRGAAADRYDTARPVDNIPPAGSVAAETGAAVGGPTSVPIPPRFAQAPGAPPVPEVPAPSLNLFQIASGSENFTTFVSMVKAANLENSISSDGPFTVLAPRNSAFGSLPPGVLENLLLPENREVLRRIVNYHIIPRRFMSTELRPGDVKTVQGGSVMFVGGAEGVLTVQGALIVEADVLASNGVIHVVDKVLVPPNVNLAALQTPGRGP